jgi:hypothetical protein
VEQGFQKAEGAVCRASSNYHTINFIKSAPLNMSFKNLKLGFPTIFFLFLSSGLLAQDNKEYAAIANEIEQSIWGSNDPIFESNSLPAAYKNESAVVLARKYSLETETKRRVAKGLLLETIREKVYINDNVSLKDFSEIGFNKLQSKQVGFWGQSKSAAYTFFGIRVIKPNGKIEKVNLTEEAVTLKSTKDEKKNKVAIPNLAIGDIVDYYITSYDKTSFVGTKQSITFVLEGEYTVLNYALSLSLDKNVAMEYQCLNGAPDFSIQKTADDDNLIQLTGQKAPKTQNLLWAFAKRQLPLIRINYFFGDISHGDGNKVKKGTIKKIDGVPQLEENIAEDLARATVTTSFGDNFSKDWVKYRKENKKDISDSAAAEFVYYYSRLDNYYSRGSEFMRTIRRLAEAEKVKTELVIVNGRNNVKRSNNFLVSDLDFLLKVYTPTPMYFSFDGKYAMGEINPLFEGEEASAYMLKTAGVKSFGQYIMSTCKIQSNSIINIKTSTAADNNQSEKLLIELDGSNPQLMSIKRTVDAKGHAKKYFQNSIATNDDYRSFFFKHFGVGTEVATSTKKESMEKEFLDNFLVKPTEIKSYAVTNFGFHHGSPIFQMQEELTVDGFVKKAGNNLIVEIGKLIGSQLEIKPEQRERTVDVDMPYAKSSNTLIELVIPAGYEIDGIEKLNKKVENETGGFVSSAKLENGKLVITTHKYYSNRFEKAANWPKLLAFIDAAFEFGKEKILLKKK